MVKAALVLLTIAAVYSAVGAGFGQLTAGHGWFATLLFILAAACAVLGHLTLKDWNR